MSVVKRIKEDGMLKARLNLPQGIYRPVGSLTDTRKLAKWFDGGIAGKKIVLSGDSTTSQLQNAFGNSAREVFRDARDGRIQFKYPEFRDVDVYARGENGGAISDFLANAFTDNHRDDPSAAFYAVDTYSNLNAIIALNADVYILCWGINDCRVTTATAYSAAQLQADLTTAVNAIRAAVPKACIILRMPNAHARAATQGSTHSVTSITRSGTTATATVASTANFGPTGTVMDVLIAGATGGDASLYNGVQSATVASGTTFTYTMTGTPGGSATGTITYDIGLFALGGTAQNCMTRYQQAYRALADTWSDVLVWDSMSGLYPNIAYAAKENVPLLNADGFHPSTSAYDQILDQIFGLLTPAVTYRDTDYNNEKTSAHPFAWNSTNSLIKWNPLIKPIILEGPDWYKVYSVDYSDGTRNSYSRWNFYDYAGVASSTIRGHAWTTGVAAPGLVPGDIISLQNRSGQRHTFVVNMSAPTLGSGTYLQFNPHPAGTWSAAETDDGVAAHPLPDGTYAGYVYRHKYAHCEGMRKLQSLLANPLKYDVVASTTNPYAVGRRFYIQATPALGAFTAQTIGSENTGDLSALTWNTTDVVCIPGVTTGLRASEYNAALALPLTGATFTADGANKRMAVTGVTHGGVLVDFSKYVIPHGYLLQAT